MSEQDMLTDYLYKLNLSFPSAVYSRLRPASNRIKQPAVPASRATPSPESAPSAVSTVDAQLLLLQDNREQVMLVNKSLMSFMPGVNAANRADILESTLLAQLGANAKVPDETDVTGWHKAYMDIMSNIGWTIEEGEVQTISANAGTREIQTVIIDHLTAALGIDLVQFVSMALENRESSGCFQVGIVTQQSGTVSIHSGTFLTLPANKIRHILPENFSDDKPAFLYAPGKLSLDQTVYRNIRNLVRQKLSGRLAEFVSEISV